MNILARGKTLWRSAAQTLFPPDDGPTDADLREQEAAERLWLDRFEPFALAVDGADVLDIGSGQAGFAALLSEGLKARSVAQIGADLSELESDAYDLVLTRSLEGVTRLDRLEEDLGQVYAALRPGGEWLLHVGCPPPVRPSFDGPGFGILTPSGWALQFLRAGFEIAETRPRWRDQAEQGAVAELLPQSSDAERLCSEIAVRLVRPWEAWELAALNR